jgi:hypothetical protein
MAEARKNSNKTAVLILIFGIAGILFVWWAEKIQTDEQCSKMVLRYISQGWRGSVDQAAYAKQLCIDVGGPEEYQRIMQK